MAQEIKRTEWTEQETDRFGTQTVKYSKSFVKSGKYITETTRRNGQIVYSANYPDGEYAQKRMSD